ncbi:MAG: lamin tail domain-containing protein [Candidatus Cloacimonetes bacterium]|nr:lamin tail domain-containing protein [Candidatus Cloacimonadota bacterium]
MKHFLFLVLCIVAIAGLHAQNIAPNPGFEQWTGGLPDGWFGIKSNIPQSDVVRDSINVHSDFSAVRLVRDIATHKRFTTQSLSVIQGTDYTITFWVRGHGEIRTNIYDERATGSGYGTYNPYIAINSATYTQYTQVVTCDNTSNNAEFIFSVHNTVADLNHLQIDDVSIIGGVANPDITVITPNGGENWSIDNSYSITWNTVDVGTVGINIQLLENEAIVANIASSVTDNGTYVWMIPQTIPIGSNYKMQIATDDGLVSDISDAVFSITDGGTPSGIVINEIMYNPPTSLGSDDNFEYVEIYNPFDIEMNLTNWQFSSAFNYTFTAGALVAAQSYLVIARNPDSLIAHYGITNVIGPFSGAINNTGETIILSDNSGVVIDSVAYSSTGDWPSAANGSGSSLELIAYNLDNNLPSSWQASFILYGTPGGDNSIPGIPTEHTIYEIQYTDATSGESPLMGEAVTTGGIVTAIFNDFFFIQDGTGAWSGIYIDETPSRLAVGDSVLVTGSVAELFNRTTIANVQDVTVVCTDTVPLEELLYSGDVSDEQWEGVLVTLDNAVVTDTLDYGEWQVDDGSGVCLIDDYGSYSYNPTIGEQLLITGVVEYSYGAFKIEPRNDADISIDTANDNNVNIYETGLQSNFPNPFNPETTIEFTLTEPSLTVLTVYNIKGQLVKTLINQRLQSGSHKVNWDGKDNSGQPGSSGIYFFKLKYGGKTSIQKATLLK